MGNNLDLVSLLGAPIKVRCPRHKEEIKSHFDEYDIECGAPQASEHGGLLVLDAYCSECDFNFEVKIKCEVVP